MAGPRDPNDRSMSQPPSLAWALLAVDLILPVLSDGKSATSPGGLYYALECPNVPSSSPLLQACPLTVTLQLFYNWTINRSELPVRA